MTLLPPPSSPRLSYFICTNPRSGSWLLSEGLAATRLAGNPREWLQEEEAVKFCAEWGITYSPQTVLTEYLPNVLKHGRTSNGVFGAKVMYYQFLNWAKKGSVLDAFRGRRMVDVMGMLFPNLRYLWLRRRDTVRQAISHVRATQTDVWWKIAGAANPQRDGTADRATFDPEAIARLEADLIRNDYGWHNYFKAGGIVPLTLYYEDLDADYPGAILHVLRWLGVTTADKIALPAPRLAKQADAQTDEWVARYAEYKAQQAEESPTNSHE